MLNKNSGHGRLIADRLNFGLTGDILVVGKVAVADRDAIQRLFIPDFEGKAHFFSTIDAAIGACTASSEM